MTNKPKHLSMLYSTVATPARTTTWRPAADVYRTREGWLLKFELAGVRMDDITVAAQGSGITVKGVRRDQIEEGSSQYSMEISYSRFERTIHLPCDLESAELNLDCKDGILLVHVRP